MTHQVHVTMEVEIFVDDEDALRQAAFERLRSAWRSDDDFPFETPGDIPLGQAVQSLLADAVPLDLPGARRSRLVMETEDVGQEDEDEPDHRSEDASDDSAESDQQAAEDTDESTETGSDGKPTT